MAVEARHLHLFHPQQLSLNHGEFGVQGSHHQLGFGNGEIRSAQVLPFSAAGAAFPGSFLPLHPSLVPCDPLPAKTSVNTESGLTHNLQQAPRKRPRDSSSLNLLAAAPPAAAAPRKGTQIPSLLGEEEILPVIQGYQLEIDTIVSHHTKKMKMEFEEMQKNQGRILAASIGERVMKKLKEKDVQIQRMAKLNFALQEKLKNLCVENQLWRDVAQSNEAAANSLRWDLEQVLAHIGDDRISGAGRAATEESSCGSCEEPEVGTPETVERMCRRCGERESSVLLLPCRHLCLCSACGSTALPRNCPVCNSAMNATLHVNMSSS